MKLTFIEMDAKHETYGELTIGETGSMLRIGIREDRTKPHKRPEYVARLGAHDTIRLAQLLLTAAIDQMERDAHFEPPGNESPDDSESPE